MQSRHRATAYSAIGVYCLDRGLRPGKVLADINLPPGVLLDHDYWLDQRSLLLLENRVAQLVGDSLCGAHIGELIALESYPDLWKGITSADSLEAAIRLLRREIKRLSTGTSINLSYVGDRAQLSVTLNGAVGVSESHHIAALLVVVQKLLNLSGELVCAEAHLPYAASSAGELKRLFGPRLAFGEGRPWVEFDRTALAFSLDAMNVPPQPSPAHHLARRCASVLDTIKTLLASGARPTAAGVADELSTNLRCMQRLLAAWGTTFEQLLDEHRKSLAIESLKSDQLSITDIAHNLGYSDSSHFTRAFRRWTGVPPSAIKSTHSPNTIN